MCDNGYKKFNLKCYKFLLLLLLYYKKLVTILSLWFSIIVFVQEDSSWNTYKMI